jgi:site-specific recombinase XerD
MDIAQHRRVIEVDWLAASSIGPHAVAFKRHLAERWYAAQTVSSYAAEVTHFARWVRTWWLPLARIDEVSVAIFLDDHQHWHTQA